MDRIKGLYTMIGFERQADKLYKSTLEGKKYHLYLNNEPILNESDGEAHSLYSEDGVIILSGDQFSFIRDDIDGNYDSAHYTSYELVDEITHLLSETYEFREV